MQINLTKEEIEKRILQLESEREQFIAQVNQRIGEYNGIINEYKRLMMMNNTQETTDEDNG